MPLVRGDSALDSKSAIVIPDDVLSYKNVQIVGLRSMESQIAQIGKGVAKIHLRQKHEAKIVCLVENLVWSQEIINQYS